MNLNKSEWSIMERLWGQPYTMMSTLVKSNKLSNERA